MNASIVIRPAADADFAAITAIMNDAILHTNGSFDTAPKSEAEMREKFEPDRSRFPLIVAEAGREIAGWASLGRYSDRCTYGDTGELSIYIGPSWKQRGIGKLLLSHLVELGWKAGFHSIIGRIGEGNPGSIALHKSCGFAEAGFLKEIGFKNGRRLGVHIFQAMAPNDQA